MFTPAATAVNTPPATFPIKTLTTQQQQSPELELDEGVPELEDELLLGDGELDELLELDEELLLDDELDELLLELDDELLLDDDELLELELLEDEEDELLEDESLLEDELDSELLDEESLELLLLTVPATIKL